MAVGQSPEARYAFVDGMVDFEVLPLQVFAALPPVVEPHEEDPEVVLRAFADHEGIAGTAAGLVDQGRGGRPAGVVQHGVVQRCQDALECVLVAHDSVFTSGLNLRAAPGACSHGRSAPPSFARSRFFLIFVPFRLYDEPKTLPWQFHLPVQLVLAGNRRHLYRAGIAACVFAYYSP